MPLNNDAEHYTNKIHALRRLPKLKKIRSGPYVGKVIMTNSEYSMICFLADAIVSLKNNNVNPNIIFKKCPSFINKDSSRDYIETIESMISGKYNKDAKLAIKWSMEIRKNSKRKRNG